MLIVCTVYFFAAKSHPTNFCTSAHFRAWNTTAERHVGDVIDFFVILHTVIIFLLTFIKASGNDWQNWTVDIWWVVSMHCRSAYVFAGACLELCRITFMETFCRKSVESLSWSCLRVHLEVSATSTTPTSALPMLFASFTHSSEVISNKLISVASIARLRLSFVS